MSTFLKPGGNSIQNILKDYSEDEIITTAKHQDGVERFGIRNEKYNIKKHSSLDEYERELEPEVFGKLFKFSTIRNPWDMCVSSYFSPHRGVSELEREDFKQFIEDHATIRKYIGKKKAPAKLTDKLNFKNWGKGKALDSHLDFLMRFENLNEDFKKVCETIDIPFQELPHRNKSSRKHYTEYYDEELIELVRTKFADEIAYANYEYGK